MQARVLLGLAAIAVTLAAGFSYLSGGSDTAFTVEIAYTVQVDAQELESVHVEMEINRNQRGELRLRMPRWTPGAYRIRRYPKNVHGFRVTDARGDIVPHRYDSIDTWIINSDQPVIKIEYGVEVPYQPWSHSFSDSTYLLIEGPSTLMYIDGQRQQPMTVKYAVPQQWQVASPLRALPENHLFYAENYDQLVDAPAQVGHFQQYEFFLDTAPIEIVLQGQADFDPDSFVTMVRKICEYQTDFFGEVPFDRFVFFYRVLPGPYAGGGLEHQNSTTIGLSGMLLDQTVLSAAEVTAHEFFHVWNAKRLMPAPFIRLDYQNETRTRELWFVEGVTSYYEALTMVRTGLWTEEQFLDEMERQIEQLQRTLERRTVSVEDASWLTWERGYLHSGVSFYNKGEVLGLLLDLKIRVATGNRVNLDTVVRALYSEFGMKKRGFTNAVLLRLINRLTAADFSEFFARYVAGTDELPYEEILPAAGLNFQLERYFTPGLGKLAFGGPRNRVLVVEERGPAYAAGLRKNDLITHFDDQAIDSYNQVQQVLERKGIGDSVAIGISREGRRRELQITLGRKENVECEIAAMADASAGTRAMLADWLKPHRN